MTESVPTQIASLRERKPVVLIVTDDPEASAAICEELGRCGYDTRISTFNGQKLKDAPRAAPKAVLFYFKDYLSAAPKILSILRERYSGASLSFIGAFPRDGLIDTELFDSVIFPPAHPAQIARRVNSMARLQKMEREIMLRIETLHEDFGIDYHFSETSLHSNFRVLFIGKASPEFMVVINALEAKDVEVIAAFTSFSAFDFLHENPFDAVIINMTQGLEPGMTISETMRRNSKLYHTPTLFLTGEGFDSHDKAYAKGVTDIIPFGAAQEEISGRILELANYYRIHQRLKTEFGTLGGERCLDATSNTYNASFLRAHLRRIYTADNELCEPTSVIIIRFAPKSREPFKLGRLKAAYDQAGRMIKNMVRMEDVAARLSEDTYVVVFPGQAEDKIEIVASRISGIISEAAFQSGERAYETLQLKVDIRAASSVAGEDSTALLARLQAALGEQPDIQQAG